MCYIVIVYNQFISLSNQKNNIFVDNSLKISLQFSVSKN